MENNMFRKNLSILLYILPILMVTYHASNLIDEVWEENRTLKEQVWELQNNCDNQYTNKISYKVTVTTYNPTRGQTDSTPNELADGTKIKPWRATDYRYVALSRDLIARWGGPFEYGDYIVIEGTDKWDGIYQVRDTMNPKWTNRVDILTTNSRFKYNNIIMYKYVDELILVENS
jgi:3D (Asp-Asp-Asp) domain-containing protein|tara:strand:- start:77 stop:601 length:525 start_codon:yes stop_codon:yes gene_type:complete